MPPVDYQYKYGDNRWHQPVISGRFQGYTDLLNGTGLYFNFSWIPAEVPIAPIHNIAKSKGIWGYVPLEEILGIERSHFFYDNFKLLAQRVFIFDGLSPNRSPSDKQSRSYVELGEFLKNMQS